MRLKKREWMLLRDDSSVTRFKNRFELNLKFAIILRKTRSVIHERELL